MRQALELCMLGFQGPGDQMEGAGLAESLGVRERWFTTTNCRGVKGGQGPVGGCKAARCGVLARGVTGVRLRVGGFCFQRFRVATCPKINSHFWWSMAKATVPSGSSKENIVEEELPG